MQHSPGERPAESVSVGREGYPPRRRTPNPAEAEYSKPQRTPPEKRRDDREEAHIVDMAMDVTSRRQGFESFTLPPPALERETSRGPPPGLDAMNASQESKGGSLGNGEDSGRGADRSWQSDFPTPLQQGIEGLDLIRSPMPAESSSSTPSDDLRDAWTKSSSDATASSTGSAVFSDSRIDPVGGGLFGSSIWGAPDAAANGHSSLPGWSGEIPRGDASREEKSTPSLDLGSLGSLGLGSDIPGPSGGGLLSPGHNATDVLAKVLGVQLPPPTAQDSLRAHQDGSEPAPDAKGLTGAPHPPGFRATDGRTRPTGEAPRATEEMAPAFLGRKGPTEGLRNPGSGQSLSGASGESDLKGGIALLQQLLPGVNLTYGSGERTRDGLLDGSHQDGLPKQGLRLPDDSLAWTQTYEGRTSGELRPDAPAGGLFGDSIWSGSGGSTWAVPHAATATGDRGQDRAASGFLQSSQW
eukprot:scaffold7624_cov248-Pinguiococcus_pyrenoidosus.AAC.13